MPDKRSYRRFNFENTILLKFESDPVKTLEGNLLDISFAGMCVFLKENVNLDVMVQAIVQFDSAVSPEQHLIGKCKVTNAGRFKLYAQEGFRIGLEFVQVDKEILMETINRIESKILDQIRKKSQF